MRWGPFLYVIAMMIAIAAAAQTAERFDAIEDAAAAHIGAR